MAAGTAMQSVLKCKRNNTCEFKHFGERTNNVSDNLINAACKGLNMFLFASNMALHTSLQGEIKNFRNRLTLLDVNTKHPS